MAWTAPTGSHSFSLFFEKKVFLRPVILSLTTCSFHEFQTTSHSPDVPCHHPTCKLEMQKSQKHMALPWRMHPAWYFTLVSQLHFSLHGTPGPVLPQWSSPSLSSAMFSVAPQILTPLGPHTLVYLPSSLSASLVPSSLHNTVEWHTEGFLIQQMGSQTGSEESDGRAGSS